MVLPVVTSTKRFRGPSGLPIWSGLASRSGPGLLDVCRHIYARAGRGAVAVFDVEDNDGLHRILNEWADIVPAHFDTYPLSRAMRRSACWRRKQLRSAGEPPRAHAGGTRCVTNADDFTR